MKIKNIFTGIFDYSVHVSMVKTSTDSYIKGSYEDFLKLFLSKKWQKTYFKNSIFTIDNNSEYHASIIMFDNVGFICKNLWTYIKVINYLESFMANELNLLPKEDDINQLLINKLKEYSEQKNISVSIVENIQNLENDNIVLGRINYYSRDNAPIDRGVRIELIESIKDEAGVLAHELGHYNAIYNNGFDRTELSADTEAYNLCKSLLSEDEFLVIENRLKIFLYNIN